MNEENAWKFKEGEKLRACSSAGGKETWAVSGKKVMQNQ